MTAHSDDPEAHFASHGWCVLREVYAPAEIAAWHAQSEALLPDAAVPWDDVGVPLTLRPSQQDPRLGDWLAREAPFVLAARVLGAASVRLLQDALLVKLPHAAHDLAWHRDATYFGYLDPVAVVSVRLALGDESRETGCLQVIDGSHRDAASVGAAFGESRVAAVPIDAASRATPVVLKAGDVSIHHCRTLHASFGNTGFSARRTLVAHVAAAEVGLVPGRLRPDLVQWFPTDSDGRLDPETFWELPRR